MAMNQRSGPTGRGARRAYSILWRMWVTLRLFAIGSTFALFTVAAHQFIAAGIIEAVTIVLCIVTWTQSFRWSRNVRVVTWTKRTTPSDV
jgi:hypothetical protein